MWGDKWVPGLEKHFTEWGKGVTNHVKGHVLCFRIHPWCSCCPTGNTSSMGTGNTILYWQAHPASWFVYFSCWALSPEPHAVCWTIPTMLALFWKPYKLTCTCPAWRNPLKFYCVCIFTGPPPLWSLLWANLTVASYLLSLCQPHILLFSVTKLVFTWASLLFDFIAFLNIPLQAP